MARGQGGTADRASRAADRRPRQKSDDPGLGLAVLRAWNDWHLDAWAGAYPDRIIPLQLPWLADPQLAAEELRRNAERGFKAVSFPELPAQCGLPSLHTGVWDPFLAHARRRDRHLPAHRLRAVGADPRAGHSVRDHHEPVPVNALVACADWLWGHPDALPEAQHRARRGWPRLGGDAGRPGRLRPRSLRVGPGGRDLDGRPAAERGASAQLLVLLDRHPSAFGALDAIGAERILIESDYPHADSTWPDTQHVVARNVANLSAEDAARITHRNAAELFRHPLPDSGWLASA